MKISVIVRSKNDKDFIGKTMDGLLRQRGVDFEIFNVDNASVDGTYEIICKKNKPENIFVCPAGNYIPGKTLNEAVRRCQGEIVVFNNSDCIPLDENYLANLIRPFSESPAAADLAAVFGNQLPRANARPLIRKDYLRAFGDGALSRGWKNFFSLASSAVPRHFLIDMPFDETLRYSEDIDWAWKMRQKKFRLQYVADARVEHSHNYTLEECKIRFYNEGIAEWHIYRLPLPFLKGFFVPCVREVLRDVVYLWKNGELKNAPYELRYRLIQRHSIFRGRRDAQKGIVQ